MRKLYFAFALLALVAAATVWFIDRGGIFPTESINYRYEVTIDTPDGPMTAYSVHRIVIEDTTMTPARNYRIDVDAEAVPFELADGSYLFATLRFKDGAVYEQMFAAAVGSKHPFAKWIDVAEQFDVSVPAQYLPTLATIQSDKDPSTLRLLEGENSFNLLSLKLITTNENVTSEVSRLLPWLVPTIKARPRAPIPIPELNILASYLKVGVL